MKPRLHPKHQSCLFSELFITSYLDHTSYQFLYHQPIQEKSKIYKSDEEYPRSWTRVDDDILYKCSTFDQLVLVVVPHPSSKTLTSGQQQFGQIMVCSKILQGIKSVLTKVLDGSILYMCSDLENSLNFGKQPKIKVN